MSILTSVVLKNIKRTIAKKAGIEISSIDDATALLFNRVSQGVGYNKKEKDELQRVFNATFRKLGGRSFNFDQYIKTEARRQLARGSTFKKEAQRVIGGNHSVKEYSQLLKQNKQLHQMPNVERRRQIEAKSLVNTLLTELAQIVSVVEDYTIQQFMNTKDEHWNKQAISESLSYIETERSNIISQINELVIDENMLAQLHQLSPYATIFHYEGRMSGTGRIEDLALQNEHLEKFIYLGKDGVKNGAVEFINDILDVLI